MRLSRQVLSHCLLASSVVIIRDRFTHVVGNRYTVNNSHFKAMLLSKYRPCKIDAPTHRTGLVEWQEIIVRATMQREHRPNLNETCAASVNSVELLDKSVINIAVMSSRWLGHIKTGA